MSVPVKIFDTATVVGAAVYKSTVINTDEDVNLLSFHFKWSPGLTGTFAIYQSNIPSPGLEPTAHNWVLVPAAEVDLTGKHPAAAAGESFVNISAVSGSQYLVIYNHTNTIGRMDCWAVLKKSSRTTPS